MNSATGFTNMLSAVPDEAVGPIPGEERIVELWRSGSPARREVIQDAFLTFLMTDSTYRRHCAQARTVVTHYQPIIQAIGASRAGTTLRRIQAYTEDCPPNPRPVG